MAKLGEYHIRKYADRKLYDVQLSKNISLQDLEDYVNVGANLVITDSENVDITTSTLLDSLLRMFKRLKGFNRVTVDEDTIIQKKVIKLFKELL